ncbi:MAG: tyrosine--tRNA ligase [Holosporales bacterium]|jgi:tyrosyl-tRNA synthetase|nr:tyrosine--tRNA ligase [Holosporales bacterium]
MPKFKSELLQVLHEREFIYQATDVDQLDEICSTKSITGYVGFDATAKSLQVGNLTAIMLLRWLQKFGHCPIVLVGGGTSLVGDPSFRQKARSIMSIEQIKENINGISKIFIHLLNFDDSANKAILVNNADWLTEIKYLDFLRDYGSLFTVNRMLSFESVKSRLDKEEPLSFLEFNYMLMQAYDFYYLNRNYGCLLQMGGADQWGNIVNGVELARKLSKQMIFGLTAPLVTNSSGSKMGKTVDGAIWLNEDMCEPYTFWQFWRNTDDHDVIRFLKKFTELPMSEIERLKTLEGSELNEAKKILADEVTALIHGRDILAHIHLSADYIFCGGSSGGDGSTLPSFTIDTLQLPISLGDLFVLTGLCASKGDFKRLVAGNGVSFQGEAIVTAARIISSRDFEKGGVLLSVGKKRHIKVFVS